MLNIIEAFLISTCIVLTYGFPGCSLPDNEHGVCVDLKRCPEHQGYYLSSGISLNSFRYQCGYFKVCCPTTSTDLINSARIKKSVRITQDDLLQCGIQYLDNRIFGGTMTDLHEFPWMALLIYQTENGPGLACGGVLISRKYVITAAHCVTGPSMRKVGKLIAVRLGEHNIETPIDCDGDEIDEDCALPHIDIFIESATPHPNYTVQSLSKYNDIALIKLSQAVNYTKDVQPICLGEAADVTKWNKPGTNLVVSGWGQTETREAGSPIKLKAKVPFVRQDICTRSYAKNEIKLGNTQICAGGGRKDSCKGDSGGPLMFEDTSDPNESRWYTVGVISFGAQPCASEGVPAVYTNIVSYLDWIKSTISL